MKRFSLDARMWEIQIPKERHICLVFADTFRETLLLYMKVVVMFLST